jgi:hypothetical protein
MLSDAEMRRFETWCLEQAASNEGIGEQLKKLGTHGELVAKRQEQETLALRIVARKLQNTEQMTIRSSGATGAV